MPLIFAQYYDFQMFFIHKLFWDWRNLVQNLNGTVTLGAGKGEYAEVQEGLVYTSGAL